MGVWGGGGGHEKSVSHAEGGGINNFGVVFTQ